MERQKLFTIFFVFICLSIALLVLYILSPFAQSILWAVLFTIIFMPIHNFLSTKLKSPTLSSFLIVSFTLFLFIVPLSIAGIIAFKEVVELTKYLIEHYKNIPPDQLQQKLLSLPILNHLIKYLPRTFADPQVITKALVSNLKLLANISASQVKAFFLSTGVLISKLFIFIFVLFFLLKDAHTFGNYIYRFFPLEEKDKRDILSSIYITTISVVYGTVGTALAQGTVGLIGYLLLGVPYPYLWGLATAYASFIPPFGASMVWVPISVWLFFKASWIKGLIMVVYGAALISSLDNVVKPLIMKNKVNAPYVVIFFAIFGGLIQFGFIGMFLGPILFNLLFTIAKIYEEKFLKGEG